MADTTYYTQIFDEVPWGTWKTWNIAGDTIGYQADFKGSFVRSEKLVLNENELPIFLDIRGKIRDNFKYLERFEMKGDNSAFVITLLERNHLSVDTPSFYSAIYPAHDLGVLARALLKQPDSVIPLLPRGKARIEKISQHQLTKSNQKNTVSLSRICGHELVPGYVWLDNDLKTFADQWSILKGWETVFPELKQKLRQAEASYKTTMSQKITRVPEQPILITNARVFNPKSGEILPSSTIVIQGNTITQVGPDTDFSELKNVQKIDARGKMAIPGLWEMHGHMFYPFDPQIMFRNGNSAPLYLAGGITTVRDMGSNMNEMFFNKGYFDNNTFIGPRILPSLYIDNFNRTGIGTIGVRVSTPSEASEIIREYARKGIHHVKIYNNMTPQLVEAVTKEARKNNMFINGHLPYEMTVTGVINSGYKEIQHIWWLAWSLAYPTSDKIPDYETDEVWFQVFSEIFEDREKLDQLVSILKEKDIAVDPSITYFIMETGLPFFLSDVIDNYPPNIARNLHHSLPPDLLFFYEAQNPLSRLSKDKAIQNLLVLIKHLHRQGVQLVAGSDAWGGDALIGELSLYVEAGISPDDVLKIATIDAARTMGMDQILGSIEEGKLADLFLVDGDPTKNFDDIRKVSMVIKNGLIYNPDDIYRELGMKPRGAGLEIPSLQQE
ncbi:amidohydrolase family protein [Zeaxanthinibacter sp. PT1]|uniref:amidohydrolase family protein n=1 Tax=Zeaxanthinibacter TaxID=561554 RepID=UPI0023497BAC|nr:amidohydrolase family protein [Zeaxanthinibacter sp. PT1]MDC6350969.1 amidohydrolase family protein [Zeaxanthinibacter sp. PT1]